MFSHLSASPGDPVGPDPAVPLGRGIIGDSAIHQGAHWQVLFLLFAVSLLLGAGVLLFAVVQRAQLQARRRARRYGVPHEAVAVPLLQLERGKAVAVVKEDWRTVAVHTAGFWTDLRERAPGWPAEAARQMVRFQGVLQPQLARWTRAGQRGSAERVTGAQVGEAVPTSALAIPVRGDARAHQGGRSRVSA